MAKAEAFVLPAGIVLHVDTDGMVLEYAGDVVLHSDLGQTLKRVVSSSGNVTLHMDCKAGEILAPKGNVTANGNLVVGRIAARGIALHGATTADDLEADGNIDVDGKNLEATNVRGGDVSIASKTVKAKVVQGTSSVSIGPVKIQADILIAPDIQLDAKSSGKVTVIEALNEVGQSGIKGGLSLVDLQEMFGNAAAFLRERSVEPLAGDGSAPASRAQVDEMDEEEPPADASSDDAGDDMSQTDTIMDDQEEEAENGHGEVPVEAAVAAPSVDPAIHQEIVDTVARIEACYADSELPPAVMRLQGLVAERDYQSIRTSITEIWNDLIKFHQQRGMRIQPQVTTTFNTINSIVRRA